MAQMHSCVRKVAPARAGADLGMARTHRVVLLIGNGRGVPVLRGQAKELYPALLLQRHQLLVNVQPRIPFQDSLYTKHHPSVSAVTCAPAIEQPEQNKPCIAAAATSSALRMMHPAVFPMPHE